METKLTAADLRVGNKLLYHIEEENTWIETTIDWQDLKWITENPNDFNKWHKPMPLTEERLVEFGFENIYKTNIYVRSMETIGAVNLKSLAVYIDENDYTVAIVDYYTGVEKVDLLHLNYEFVHQLQNIWKVLANTELTIKEDNQ